MIGCHYHRVYGYPWRWAIPAEVMWRIEHMGPQWLRMDGRPLGPISRFGYRWNKRFERKGVEAQRTP